MLKKRCNNLFFSIILDIFANIEYIIILYIIFYKILFINILYIIIFISDISDLQVGRFLQVVFIPFQPFMKNHLM